MFRFSNPEYLYLMLLAPVALLLYMYTARRQRHQIEQLGSYATITSLMPGRSAGRGWLKATLVALAMPALSVALAGPQFGSKLTEVKHRGVELIIALDVSNSMLAQDLQPNRIERAKQAIAQLVDKLAGDRIGLIVFAGDAYMQLPITNDYASAKMFLSSISPGMVSKQGTDMGSAIALAMSSFPPDGKTGRAIIVISDGENHEGDPLGAVQQAAERGVVVHTIGIGSPDGAPIPLGPGGSFLKDDEGRVVVSRLDEETLSKVAVMGNGRYVRATNAQIGLLPLFEHISKMQRAETSDRVYSDYNEQFQYAIGLALLLLLLEFVVLERKNRWLARLNLFGADTPSH
ncbi:MAG: VWA domain-containing protein [Bacteroidales bacterium]|nr:VWA domain-containing protein [Bacteroidales bacterium]